MPFQTVSPDGSELLVGLGREFDVNGILFHFAVVAVDLADGTTQTIAEFDGSAPNATWSSDGQWIALFWQDDITLINADNPQRTIQILDVIPPDHFPLAAG